MARHDPETLGLKAEVRELMTAMRSGEVSAGVGSVLLQAIRLLRELEADERLNDAGDALIESIQALRNRDDVPDLSEPAANDPHGGASAGVVDLSEPSEPYDPDAPKWDDYHSADAFIRDSHVHRAMPLSHLTVEQRRARFASGKRA